MGMTPSWDSISAQLAEVQRRLNDLETGQRLGNSAVNQGAVIARDASGTERARYGQLADGSFGLAAENIVVVDPATGQQIPLAQALFGISIISRTSLLTVPASGSLDWSPVTATDYVSVKLSGTGRALVMGSVQVGYTGVNEVAFALEVRNNAETTVIVAPAVTAGSLGTRVGATAGVTVPLFGQFTGPPNTTVKCRVRFDAIGSDTADVQSATVIVWPV